MCLMKRGISIVIGIIITIIVIILGVSWLVGSENKTQQSLVPITNSTPSIGKNYSMNLTENVGMQAK